MGLFDGEHFRELGLKDDQLNMIAKLANTIIGEAGVVLYGVKYKDGTYENFTREKKQGDSHILLAILTAEMGLLPPRGKAFAKDEITPEERARINERLLLERERELHNKNQLLKKYEGAKPPGGHPHV